MIEERMSTQRRLIFLYLECFFFFLTLILTQTNQLIPQTKIHDQRNKIWEFTNHSLPTPTSFIYWFPEGKHKISSPWNLALESISKSGVMKVWP